jgi:hypothetical protein
MERMMRPSYTSRGLTLLCLLILAGTLLGHALGHAQNAGSGVFPSQGGQSVVMENGVPAIKFVSQSGSVAFVYFRRYESEDAFAIPLVDWDTAKTHSGWFYITQTRAIFETDDAVKTRNFKVPRTEVTKVKYMSSWPAWTNEHHMEMKVSGKGKRFLISFSPMPPSVRGAHQKPVIDFIHKAITDFEATVNSFQSSAAKLQSGAPTRLQTSQIPTDASVGTNPEMKTILDISSEPTGAEIFINGVFNSSTPSKLKLGVGEYTIKVSRPGFKDWERRILVEAGSSKTLNAILEKLP